MTFDEASLALTNLITRLHTTSVDSVAIFLLCRTFVPIRELFDQIFHGLDHQVSEFLRVLE